MKIKHQKDIFNANNELSELIDYVNSFKILFNYSAKFPFKVPSEDEDKESETTYLESTKRVNTKSISGLLESLEKSKDLENFKLDDVISFELGVYGGHVVLVTFSCNDDIKYHEDSIELDIKSIDIDYIERGTREKLPLSDYFESKTAKKFKQAQKLARLVL